MSAELLHLWEETRPAVLFVTHDLDEAIALADRVILMSAGPAATIKGVFPIDLPRPRPVQEIRFDPQFAQLRHRIWQSLRDDVRAAFATHPEPEARSAR
jgi:NitT/TauT family transport system ATP-binding protein